MTAGIEFRNLIETSMATPNYRHLKKQREATKKREQESKREKRQSTRAEDTAAAAVPVPAPTSPESN